MPTYKNLSESYLTVNGVNVGPYEQIETQKYLNNSNLELVSSLPYYNLLLADATYSNPSNQSITVDSMTSHIRLFPTANVGTVTVYINDVLNTPGLIVTEGIDILCQGRINNLIINGSGSINIKQFK